MSDRYQLAPALSSADRERLRESIAEHGVLIPITVDQAGNVIDGHHRRDVAAELGVDCPREAVECSSEEERLRLSVALNADRRQLTDAQRAAMGRRLEARLAEEARKRMAEAGASAAPGRPTEKGRDNSPRLSEEGKTRSRIAQQVGLGSGRTYERHRKTLDRAEEVAPDIAAKADSGELDMRGLGKELRRREKEHRVAAIAAAPTPEPAKLVAADLLYVDPPWRYQHSSTDSRKIENHYPTMGLEEIKALDVPAAADAVLFMWATSPKLAEALEVVDAWGFGYRTCMVWVKDRVGMGYYARQRHELLLIAVKGKPDTPLDSARPDSVIEAPRGEHSAKPVRVYELIEAMYPHLTKVELFARAPRDGWASWGNQAGEAA